MIWPGREKARRSAEGFSLQAQSHHIQRISRLCLQNARGGIGLGLPADPSEKPLYGHSEKAIPYQLLVEIDSDTCHILG
jgi:hypothetical protein